MNDPATCLPEPASGSDLNRLLVVGGVVLCLALIRILWRRWIFRRDEIRGPRLRRPRRGSRP